MTAPRLILAAAALALLTAAKDDSQRTYRWVDDQGVVHYGDVVPPEYADKKKQVLNEQGVTVDVLEGRKTEEELAEEARIAAEEERRMRRRRADQALLATYLSVEEIELHRERRLALLDAQSRVTELYLGNLRRRLESLMEEASGYQPYSEDPEAEMIPADLSEDIAETRARIERYEGRLAESESQADTISARFEADIDRFRALKGLN